MEAFLRRLRSLLPVSPVPWHWQSRVARAAVALIALLVVGWAIASILFQGGSDADKGKAEKLEASPPVRGILDGMSAEERASQVLAESYDGPGHLRIGGTAGGVAPLLIADESLATQSPVAMKAAGFNLVLAPVADVATIGSPAADQAFSDDPAVVAEMTEAALRSCAEAEIACAVSHFPGQGGASDDPVDGPATVSLDQASLHARDLRPFQAAFRAHVPAVVLSLAFFAAYDPVTPGALSHSIVTDLLRDEMGFEGLALTDDLSSGAISAGIGAGDAAVQAIAAGADVAVVSDPAEAAAAREALLAAARSGEIPKDRLERAAARVLTLKEQLGLLP